MGALSDTLDGWEPTPAANAGCGVGRLWVTLDPDDRAALVDLLFVRRVTDQSRAEVIGQATGVSLQAQTFGKHRRHHCGCPGRGWAQPDG